MRNLFKILGFTALTLLASALSPAASAGDTLQRVIDFKTLKVGMTADQPPMNMVNREKALMGFDVDLAKALANAMRVKLEIKVMPFAELMTALEDERIDMVVSNMAITPERSEQATFIGPYMMSGKSILARDSVLARISNGEQFNREELTLAALKNSTSAGFVREAAPEARLIEVAHYDEAVRMVMDGDADGMVADMPVCLLSVLRFPDAGLVTLERPLTVEPIGIAVAKGDPEFHNLVDNYLEAYTKIGLLAQLRKKWMEDNAWLAALP
ncbi:transporter substrate-binding domain-containing protein [Parahaliea mediterranea]|uniref:Transporter substrate-binding domain-containing protein n=1 Tax=Parahaliea mediterranea TaxID=651086 RepID=A0A939DGD4_9GAMM|nr:transporter substrate-binding domain-containing protein [Parahaliea mediterranea]MBN7797032.1 transporter substrate-binding domain-containing protein [Parahaliea mediterranea]